MKRFIPVVFLVCSIVQCSSLQKHSVSGKVHIELKGRTGETTDTRYFSNSKIRSYSESQLLRDREEAVDFTVRTHVEDYNPQSKILKFTLKTIAKDGTSELHDLAFPEKNESIQMVIRGDGTVLKAGAYDPHGLFYVPQMPVPSEDVAVGDTWTMEHTWTSARDGVPLKIEVVGILKDVVNCLEGKTCADIEVSGHVNLAVAPDVQGARFNSRVWGRMLFALERGEVIWSEMRSEEEMVIQGERLSVLSCMVSETLLTGKPKTKLECDPKVTPVASVPRL